MVCDFGKLVAPKILFCTAMIALLSGCGSGPVQIPTSYAPYYSKGGTFQCEVPESWEAKGGGKQGPEWAKISSGDALIHVRVGVAGSLMSDAVGGNIPGGGNLPQFEPVHIFHVAGVEMAEQEHEEYTELPGSPVVLQCKLGPARISEFTARSAFGTDQHGYRATIIGHNRSLNVICICQESDWTALKPTFDKLFVTMDQGENY